MKKTFFALALSLQVAALTVLAVAKGPSNGVSTSSAITFNGAEVQPGKFVIKVHPAYRSLCSVNGIAEPRFQAAYQALKGRSVDRKFKAEHAPTMAVNRYGKPVTDLSLVYQLNIDPAAPVKEVVDALMATGMLVYAEPLYVNRLCYTPNDPNVGQQYALTKINAYNAWNISRGDTNVVVGIVDSGTDWDHPDLQANIAYNWNDPIDGVDNDNDTYIDNFRGWDVSENDNDPMVVNSDHGSHVSGCAAAVTDNGVGVAGPGFNCRFLPVKSCLDASATSIDNGYDGVYYAATHGCDVINCSWGRAGGPSQFEQDVVNFAVLDHDAVFVAAAGNNSIEEDHYPSSYDNSVSVASTTNSDSKSGFSNYGFGVDVCAPGSNIYATVFNDAYTSYSGTSMASPIAAGGVALIRARFPSLNAIQAAQQLRNTCDNINGSNALYVNKLGKGRINLYRAVTDSTSPGVRVKSLAISDGNDNVFVAGDTLRFVAVFENVLRPTANLVCNLTSTNTTNITLINTPFAAGVLNTFDTVSNFAVPFRAVVNAGTPLNTEIPFRITMADGTWSDFYGFKVVVNVDYINIEINDVGTSITSKGLIGYNESGQVQGIGFKYMGGPTILYEMGLMVGAGGPQVSDNVRDGAGGYNTDFASTLTVSGQHPGTYSDFDAFGKFRDNGATSANPLPVLVTHRAFAWSAPAADRKYIIVDYTIRNYGTSTLSNLFGGIFADWDIPAYSNNKAAEDLNRRMGYCWSTDSAGLYAGIKLLTSTPFNHYALDNVTGGGGGVDASDGFDETEKYTALSTGRAAAGNTAPTGNDVLDVVSTGPFTLAAGDSVRIAFALIAGENLPMIQAAADAAQVRYDALTTTLGTTPIDIAGSTGIKGVFPNPASTGVSIQFGLATPSKTEVSIYSLTGDLVKALISEQMNSGLFTITAPIGDLSAGSYLVRFTSGDKTEVRPLQIVR